MARNLYEVDEGGKLTLNFHPGQTQAWESEKRFVFVLAGTQGGKTSFSPWWLRREIINTAVTGEPNDYIAVTSSFDLYKLRFLPEMIKVFCEVLNIGKYWAADRLIELKSLDPDDDRYMKFYANRATDTMWARIILRSAQSEGGLESTSARAAILDEAGQDEFRLGAWEAVLRRLSLSQGRVLGITTLYNLGWIYETVYLPWQDGDPDIDVIQFPSYYNPRFSKAEYERAKRTLPDWKFAMFYDGKFKRPAGLIYHDFDESTMLVRDEFSIPLQWERVVGVDFGGANTATLWLALNPADSRWYAYHETLMGHLSTPDHAAIATAEATGIENLVAVGGAKAESQERDDWTKADFYIEEPSIKSVESGIARVIELLKTDRLRIFHSCTRLRRELKNYRRKLDDRNEPTEQIVNKSKFHGLDSLRYASVYITDAPAGVEALTYDDIRDQL